MRVSDNPSKMIRNTSMKMEVCIKPKKMAEIMDKLSEETQRLDSYNPRKGEIVSRKATDLDMIELETFEKYLKEMDKKYSVGTVIRSNKYKRIDGEKLQGRHILEIPKTNESLDNIQEYKDIANKYNIELRFTEE